ncbi:hypothetical protein [Desulforhabdus sp. TSK]|uniref:hypothetical protein n=1 Tax=Desulforhabdus sp. TSK TaxID=2925014 RepID=UPI001FC86F3B|nr:hypothetical protein [Desulforhabdus sp. TSK]GKT10541.1 hypothetical protein DSTSK_38460 [Desulforhabdus sp. TSK]
MSNVDDLKQQDRFETVKRLFESALEEANGIVAENWSILQKLVPSPDGDIQLRPEEVPAVLLREMARLEANYKKDSKSKIGQIKALYRLFCASNISGIAVRQLGSIRTSQAQDFPPSAVLGAQLIGLWHGQLLALRWMDEDGVMSLFKAVHHKEVAGQHRATRSERQAEKMSELVGALRRKHKNSKKPLMDCARATLDSRKHDKNVTPEKLIIAYMEPQLEEAFQSVCNLWDEGDEGTHVEMTDFSMSRDYFNALDSESRKILRNELLSRFREAANRRYPDRLFGSKGVRKSE